MKKFALGSLMAVCAAALIVPATAQNATSNKLLGKPMVPFKMTGLDGKTYTNANFKGKVVLMDFWATWCGPCKAASPKLQEMHTNLKAKGLMVVGANAGERVKDGSSARAYVKEHGYSYLFTYNNDSLFESVGTQGYPTFVLIDRKGVVRDVVLGFQESKIKATITKLLAEK